MSIKVLYVEGKLDSQIVNALASEEGLNGLTIMDKGSKEGLQSRVMYERERSGYEDIFYLRDRDFDFDVCLDVNSPIEIKRDQTIIGWHWCRHEVENYLLEPAVLSQVFCVSEQEIIGVLISAALSIRTYEIARWTIGYSKRRGMLPPHYDIASRHSPRQMGQGFPRTTKLALLLLRRGIFSYNSFFLYGKHSRNIWSFSSKKP